MPPRCSSLTGKSCPPFTARLSTATRLFSSLPITISFGSSLRSFATTGPHWALYCSRSGPRTRVVIDPRAERQDARFPPLFQLLETKRPENREVHLPIPPNLVDEGPVVLVRSGIDRPLELIGLVAIEPEVADRQVEDVSASGKDQLQAVEVVLGDNSQTAVPLGDKRRGILRRA